MPKKYGQLLSTFHGTSSAILEAERDLFGWDHCEAGRNLIRDWNLPADFEPIVTEHHQPRQKDNSWDMTELIHMSCHMADAAGYPAFPGCETSPYTDLLEELPARERRMFHGTVEVLTAEIATRIEAVEAA
jgi:hypothetical protein